VNVAAVLGPTAAGKSSVAEMAADRFGASILSVDSMQVYQEMDIGTAKPLASVRERLEHHMIDVADPGDEFSVMEFQMQGREVLRSALASDARIIIAGGSGLHFRSLVDPMTFAPTDPDIRRELEGMTLQDLQQALRDIDSRSSEVLDVHNSRRVIRAIEIWRITGRTPSERAESVESADVRSYSPLIEHVSVGLDAGDRSTWRVEARFDAMMRDGLFEEVEALYPKLGRTAAQALGYKQLIEVVRGNEDKDSATMATVRATNALVKRQRTFFRRDPRIEWIPWQDDDHERIASAVDRLGEVAGWTS
jgi:tRNA dimethylallyltransferase